MYSERKEDISSLLPNPKINSLPASKSRAKVSRILFRAYHQRNDAPVGSKRIDGRAADAVRLGAAGERGVAAHRCGRVAGLGRRIGQREDDVIAGVDGLASAGRASPRRSVADGVGANEKIDGPEGARMARSRRWRDR